MLDKMYAAQETFNSLFEMRKSRLLAALAVELLSILYLRCPTGGAIFPASGYH